MPRALSRFVHLAALAALVAAAGCQKNARQHYEAGRRYQAEGRAREAIIEFRNAVQKDPKLGEAQRDLGRALLAAGDRNEALGAAVRAADLLPTDVDVQLEAARGLLAARQFDEARARADRALALAPERVELLVVRAQALAGLSDFDAAVDELQKAIALEPKAGLYASLGAMQLARGDKGEAEATLRKAVGLDPRSVEAQLALANFLWTDGRVAEAEKALVTAHGLDANSVVANRALAVLYLATRRPAEAESFLRVVADRSQGPNARFDLVSYYLAYNRPAEALKELETLERQPQAWSRARSRIALVRFGEGKKTEALALLDQVLAKDPKQIEPLLIKAHVLLAESRTDDALKAARAAVSADSRNLQAQYLLGTILASQGQVEDASRAFNEVLRLNPKASAAQVQLARLELMRGASHETVKIAGQAVANDPGSAAARLMLVRGLIAERQLSEAAKELEPLRKELPDDPVVEIETGRLRFAQGDRAASKRAFERALKLAPGAHDALAGLTTVDLAERRFEEAEARLAALLTQNAKDARLLLLGGRTALAAGKPALGETRLRAAIEADPATFEAYTLLGRLYLTQGKLDQALAEFDALIVKQPRSIGPQTIAAMIVQVQGKTADARRRYERIVQLDPRAAVAANNLAWIYAQQGENLGTALELAQAAKQRVPDLAEIDDTLGFVYLKRNAPELAIPLFADAVAKDPNNPNYRYRLGLAYSRTGQGGLAKRELEQALKLNAAFDGAEEARRLLATVK